MKIVHSYFLVHPTIVIGQKYFSFYWFPGKWEKEKKRKKKKVKRNRSNNIFFVWLGKQFIEWKQNQETYIKEA